MERLVVGIDPGNSGALVLVSNMSGILRVTDMPVLEEKVGCSVKKRINPPAVADALAECRIFGEFDVLIERIAARPGQGVTSMFNFGRGLGVIEGVVSAMQIRLHWVSPQAWQSFCKVKGKEGSRSRATELFPREGKLFARVKDDGRADAALIGFWGVNNL